MIQSRTHFISTLALFLFGLVWLVGCTGKSPKADFYVLTAIPAAASAATALSGEMAIAVGPVSLPAELDRKQIVTRDAGNRLKIAELHRWAGPLQDNITSALTTNLTALLGTDRVAPYNRESLFPFTHHVVISINRFDGWPAGEILLDVTWSIKRTGVSEPLIVQRSEIRKPVATADYAGIVAAQSKALAEISSRIADALKQLVQ